MNSGILFILAVLCVALIALLVVFKSPGRMVRYFKTKEGKGVLAGIALFISFGVIFVFGPKVFAEERHGTWFKYGEVFLGLDSTNHQSPMCDDGQNSSRLTSNGGLRFNIYQSGDKRFEFNTKYTHHSCAFNADSKGYDAPGIELNYKFFVR